MKLIRREQRIKWDILIFFVIIMSAFEIPYSLIIGWKNPKTALYFDIFFYCMFIIDIYINFNTITKKRYSGFIDWRDFASLFSYALSEENYKKSRSIPDNETQERREVTKEYMTSKWFIIDVLSIIPFDLILGSLGFLNAARILRLSRIPRLLRLIKSLKLGSKSTYAQISDNYPSVIRFAYMFILMPFFIHLYTCLLFLVKPDQARNFHEYLNNFNIVFKMLKTGLPSELSTGWEMALSYIIAFTGMVFFGVFIGNFASLFMGLDKKIRKQ